MYNRCLSLSLPEPACDHAHQSRDHILWDCPRYLAQRRTCLKGYTRTRNTKNLLSTGKGRERLLTFIETSGAFTKSGLLTTAHDLANREFNPD
jgi:hypothetical protein